jgi:3-oxoacyl-[acyl-carrier-protein] synthase II
MGLEGRALTSKLAVMKRVAVTGLGAVTPLGNDAPSTWRAAVAGESGIDFIRSFDASGFPVRVAAEVKDYEPNGVVSPKEARRLDRNVLLALGAAKEAIDDAGLTVFGSSEEWVDRSVQTDARAEPARPEGGAASGASNGFDPARVGVVFGSAIGGFLGIMQQHEVLQERGPDRVSPHFLPNVLVDSASGQLAISLGLRGPNYAPVSACATGSHAIGEAAEIIRRGDADAILAGGTEACMHPLILAGFCAMRGLAAEEEHPPRASRPFDATRAGFVMGEGACVLVLEDLDAAQARGAKIYAQVLGYGASNDAYHMAAPDPDSVGVAEMMHAALARARVDPGEVGYINAHGTSTPLGDLAETKAVKEVFGDHAYDLAISSTKSMMGHCFGAAGAIEGMMCVLALHDGMLPPTINYEHPDPECDLDYVPNEAREAEVRVALSNAMGLGGHNGCVLFARADHPAVERR